MFDTEHKSVNCWICGSVALLYINHKIHCTTAIHPNMKAQRKNFISRLTGYSSFSTGVMSGLV